LVFPRINNGLRVTLFYYDIKHISSAVGVLSGKFTQAKMLDENGKELPPWDEVVFLLHAQLEDEIKQIINLNYPHVRNMVLEDLREFIETPPIKSVQKERITKLLLDFNASEEERILTKHPNGFSLGADPAFLPQYFIIVENALNNLKRIINKYLKLYDTGQLPVYQPQSYLPPNVQSAPSLNLLEQANENRLKTNMSVEQLTMLFRLLKECKLIEVRSRHEKEIHAFIAEHFDTIGKEGEKASIRNIGRLWSSKEPDVLNYWIAKFKELSDKAEKK
jgi:hypothetical protein